MKKIFLEMQNVFKEYRQGNTHIPVLKGINICFEQGTSYAITGISGSGKSTLMHLLAGLDAPNSGTVLFNGNDIAQMPSNEKSFFLNRSIGLVFQSPYLIKELNVLENVMIKSLIARMLQKECAQEALVLLEQVGLSSKIDAYPGQLSGGQQQRVALARALMNKPVFLLADEPTGNLDMQTGIAIIDLVLKAQAEWGMGIIISPHDEYVTNRMEIQYELNNGLLLEQR